MKGCSYEETGGGAVGAACMAARAAVSDAPSPNAPVVGARMARPEPGAIYAGPAVHVPGHGGMWACRPTPTAVGGVPCTRGRRADVGIGPYEKTESGSVQVFVNLLGLPLC